MPKKKNTYGDRAMDEEFDALSRRLDKLEQAVGPAAVAGGATVKRFGSLTAVAVPTDASTNTSPYGYTQTQADDIVTTINAIVTDLQRIITVLNS